MFQAKLNSLCFKISKINAIINEMKLLKFMIQLMLRSFYGERNP